MRQIRSNMTPRSARNRTQSLHRAPKMRERTQSSRCSAPKSASAPGAQSEERTQSTRNLHIQDARIDRTNPIYTISSQFSLRGGSLTTVMPASILTRSDRAFYGQEEGWVRLGWGGRLGGGTWGYAPMDETANGQARPDSAPSRPVPSRPDKTGPGQAESLTDFRSGLDPVRPSWVGRVPPGQSSGPIPVRQTAKNAKRKWEGRRLALAVGSPSALLFSTIRD